mgnify:CR=1 FL=1
MTSTSNNSYSDPNIWTVISVYLNRAGMSHDTAKDPEAMLYYYFEK